MALDAETKKQLEEAVKVVFYKARKLTALGEAMGLCITNHSRSRIISESIEREVALNVKGFALGKAGDTETGVPDLMYWGAPWEIKVCKGKVFKANNRGADPAGRTYITCNYAVDAAENFHLNRIWILHNAQWHYFKNTGKGGFLIFENAPVENIEEVWNENPSLFAGAT